MKKWREDENKKRKIKQPPTTKSSPLGTRRVCRGKVTEAKLKLAKGPSGTYLVVGCTQQPSKNQGKNSNLLLGGIHLKQHLFNYYSKCGFGKTSHDLVTKHKNSVSSGGCLINRTIFEVDFEAVPILCEKHVGLMTSALPVILAHRQVCVTRSLWRSPTLINLCMKM